MINFIDHPGIRERHLKRRYNNPLFPAARRQVSSAELNHARAQDHAELEEFHQQFQHLLQRAVALKPNEQSEVILELKADLDKAYAIASGLTGDLSQIKIALQKLISVTMNAVWEGAGNDKLAHDELTHEEEARSVHFAHLRYPLVATLVRPDSPITHEDLVPSLLSAEPAELQAALWLFEPVQLADIDSEAKSLLASTTEPQLHELVESAVQLIGNFINESVAAQSS